ncbi:MAG TPA: PhzF family phenazine biosynthesis protein [Acidocella sp.]|uniref:PhzF family phenazine biosynthesis protein n=1 Tax=Acidocella sp. TaxID=50710 RepID=UPI002C1FBC85|nr:PhzF family phenazine biosynthesis protein [Acidocella sp.]HVE22091.1 PhzF family phenazine biosynthesis protein [Acidocella sp.]
MQYKFSQVDVFTAVPYKGNPLAVVHGADALSDAQMAAFANWTNLSETAFLLQPTDGKADYRVRIFTPTDELPFAGHPTLGACHAWLAAGGRPKGAEIVQQCEIGLIRVRRKEGRLAFAAPPATLVEVDAATLARVAASLRVDPAAILVAQHVSQKPAWIAALFASREEVLALQPDFAAMGEMKIGAVGPAQGETDFEVRGFVPGLGEDPVTGSLNAGLARWLIGTGRAPARYTAAQGTALGRAGRIYLEQEGADIWVGGDCVTCITGDVVM